MSNIILLNSALPARKFLLAGFNGSTKCDFLYAPDFLSWRSDEISRSGHIWPHHSSNSSQRADKKPAQDVFTLHLRDGRQQRLCFRINIGEDVCLRTPIIYLTIQCYLVLNIRCAFLKCVSEPASNRQGCHWRLCFKTHIRYLLC